MKLRELGEFGLIDKIHEILGNPNDASSLGIGDDTAAFPSRPGWLTLMTTDALVEDVHFDFSYTPPDSLGWKALAINLSDIAAMGGLPRAAVISLALPDSWTVERVEALYSGLSRCAEQFQCPILGGDMVRSKNAGFISVTAIGEVEEEKIVRRSGARSGDLVGVTGMLGGSRLGLEILQSCGNRDRYPVSVHHFLEPVPRISEARQLVKTCGLTSLIDISDGLSSELGHLCRMSRCGCRIHEDKIPLSEEAASWCRGKGLSGQEFALGSGEEYELLFTLSGEQAQNLSRTLEIPVTLVGEITPMEDGLVLVTGSVETSLPNTGWNHFE